MKLIKRTFEILTGLVLITMGVLIVYGFHAFGWKRGHDVWDVGFLLLVEAYSIVGSLFILLGLRYALGKPNFIERWISHSLRHFALAVGTLSLFILAAVIYTQRVGTRRALTPEETRVIAIARQAVATNDTWLSQAEFDMPEKDRLGNWSVFVWYIPRELGGSRHVVIDTNGNVIRYDRGK